MKILLTGATGYIGGNLVPELLHRGHVVTVLVRDAGRLPDMPWVHSVRIVIGDIRDEELLSVEMEQADTAYYLIHSMGESRASFHAMDIGAGEVFGRSAAQHGVRIIFLGALGHVDVGLTEHLRSRHETGRALARTGSVVTEFRAGPVIGSGSLPFEMVRYLPERVPVMICPRWVFTKVQPIALRDVIAYLADALDLHHRNHRVLEIGGADVLTYGEMMTRYAQVRGLRRLMIRVPVLTPSLSSYWVHWVTPLKASFARPLIEGLKTEVVVRDSEAAKAFQRIVPRGYLQSVTEALADLQPSDGSSRTDPLGGHQQIHAKGMIQESRRLVVEASRESVFSAFTSLGSQNGWYMDWGWRLRGLVDTVLGGVGLRRTRPNGILQVGDTVDFWRVQAIEQGRRLLLHAEMKLPGEAWLEFKSEPCDEGTLLIQTSYFAPKGLFGLVYWFGLLPIHRFVFDGLIRRVGTSARSTS